MGMHLHDPRPSGNLHLRVLVGVILTTITLLLAATHEGPSGDVPERILDTQVQGG